MKKRTMFGKILPPLAIAALVQAGLFVTAILASGTLEGMSRQSTEIITSSLDSVSAATTLRLQNSTPDFRMISQKVEHIINKSIASGETGSIADFINRPELKDRLIKECYPDLIMLEDIADSEAVFLILPDISDIPDIEKPHTFPGVFLYDGDHGGRDEASLVLLRGKRELAEGYGFFPDVSWAEGFSHQPGYSELDYFWEPYYAAFANPGLETPFYTHWSSPFFVEQTSALGSLTSVSAPIIVGDRPVGVIGVSYKTSEIFDYAMNRAAGAYILVQYASTGDEAPFNSPDFKEMNVTASYSFAPDVLSFTSGANGIRLIKNPLYPGIFDTEGLYFGGSPAAAAIADLKIYPPGSPYDDARWAFITARDSETVFSVSRILTLLIAGMIFVSTIDALLIAIFASRFFSKGIRKIVSVVMATPADSVIPPIDSDIFEIDMLGAILRKASEENRAAEDRLQAERERYYIALRSSSQNFIDYDAATDLLKVDILTGSEITKIEYPGFLDNISTLRVVYQDDIAIAVKFLRGQITSPVDFRVWSQVTPGKLMWFQAKPYYIYDEGGKLRRTISSIRDITEDKQEKNKREKAVLRDSVTDFYRADYAVTVVRDYLLGEDIVSYAVACVVIDNFRELAESFGRFFCDALVYEAASVMKKRFGEKAVFIRTCPNEFAVICPNDNLPTPDFKTSIYEMAEFSVNAISSIVISDEANTAISVSAGIYVNDSAKNSAVARQRAEYAEAAAVMRRFGSNIVFWTEVESDYNFTERVDIYGVLESVRFPEDSLPTSSEGGINAFAFNILEKTNDIRSAVQMLLSRLGTEFGLRRVSLFMFDRAGVVFGRMWQWNEPGCSPLPAYNISVSKAVKNDFNRVMDGTEYIILDEGAGALPKFLAEGTGFEGGNFGAALPLSDSDGIMGVLVAEGSPDVIENADFITLRETVKVLAAFLAKNRSSTESKAKSEFLSKMSHEIRTPMNAIIGMSQIALADAGVTPKQREYLWKIDYSAKYLLTLINDILDMSRIESGKTKTDITEVDFSLILEALDSIIGTQSKQKAVNYIVDINIPSYRFMSDSLKLNQIFMNLLGNAIKFTSPGGTVTFSVSAGETAADGTTPVTFSVTDTGIGIKPERIHKIFEAFEQEEASTARQYGGTGLGLPIANSYVSMLGGELSLESEVGVGSKFFFTIPVEFVVANEEPGAALSAENQNDLKGSRILIAEDDELNMEIAKTLLEQQGFVIECAENGQIAVDMWKSRPEGYYRLILMDIRMPVMDGLEASRTIRSENRPDAATIPIVALSANAFDEDREMSQAACMNAHIIKPIDMRVLIAKIREILGSV
jgi:signal transduction histidine kinase/CheY-like chemotaxis protein/GGDEF domain-containing protein